jgi:hypothetical protein
MKSDTLYNTVFKVTKAILILAQNYLRVVTLEPINTII